MSRVLKSLGIVIIFIMGIFLWINSQIESTSSYVDTIQVVSVVNNHITVKHINGDLVTYHISRPKLTIQLNKDIKYTITTIKYTNGEVYSHNNLYSILSR